MKKSYGMILAIIVLSIFILALNCPSFSSGYREYFWDFEDVKIGTLPQGWVVEATNQYGPLATWKVKVDDNAPSGKKVLSLVRINHSSGSTFNLCWTRDVFFLDGEISVYFRANTGRIDQGGGIIWRAKDKDNYYVARFNPLEDNFRVYYVKKARRHLLKSADVSLSHGKFHFMKIVQRGDRFECYLDGKLYLKGKDDTFKGPGGVGLWTKADAATSFDDFRVKSFGDNK